MTNEEAAAMLESMKDYFLPTSPMLEERREEITAIDLAISALSKQSASSEQANDTDRTTDDQCGDGARMIDLKKRTITERLIIANSLIASAIADSDNNQFPEDTKKTDDVPDTNDGDIISRQAAIDALMEQFKRNTTIAIRAKLTVEGLPSAQPTLCGYNIEHLMLIADVLRKENLPPERVAETLTDIGRIVSIVTDEFNESLQKAVEQCKI